MNRRKIAYAVLATLIAATGSASATEASYTCSGGGRLTAIFSPPSESLGQVTLRIAGSPGKIVLPQVMSADGGRYANQNMEFWIKGNNATFTRQGQSETCHTR